MSLEKLSAGRDSPDHLTFSAPDIKNNYRLPDTGRLELAKKAHNTNLFLPHPTFPTEPKKAEFLPEVANFLKNCKINTEFVNAVPMGKGSNHLVYEYNPPGQEKQVIKIPRTNFIGTLNAGKADEEKQIFTVRKYFPDFMPQTEVRLDPVSHLYLILQNKVIGKAVNNRTVNQLTRDQLKEIVRINHELLVNEKASLDFVGMPGFISWLKKQAGKILQRKSEFEISNLLVDDATGKVFIIDYDILRFKNVTLKQNLLSRLGFFVNRLLMKHYFKVDIKQTKDKTVPALRPSFA